MDHPSTKSMMTTMIDQAAAYMGTTIHSSAYYEGSKDEAEGKLETNPDKAMQYLAAIDQVFSNHEDTKEKWEMNKSAIDAQWLEEKEDIKAKWGDIDETATTSSDSNDEKTAESTDDNSSATNTEGMSANDVAEHLRKVKEEQAEQERQEALASNDGPTLVRA